MYNGPFFSGHGVDNVHVFVTKELFAVYGCCVYFVCSHSMDFTPVSMCRSAMPRAAVETFTLLKRKTSICQKSFLLSRQKFLLTCLSEVSHTVFCAYD